MNSLTLLVLLFAAIQVQCSPAVPLNGKDGHAPEGDKNAQKEVGVNKEERQLLFGDNKSVMKKDKDVIDYMEEKERVKKYNKNDTPAKELNDVTKDEESDVPIDDSGEYGSGEDIIEGDIKVTPEEAAIFKRGGWKELVNSESWVRGHGKWSRTIPYTVSDSNYPLYTEEYKALEYSIELFHKFTCLKFVPKKSYHKDYIDFASKTGCWSYIGKLPEGYARPQEISLGRGCRGAIPAHEIMHALGRGHEQSRFNRDKYVHIINDNIHPNFTHNFDEDYTDNMNIPYDYLSVMHYGSTAFSINGQPTIKAVPGPDIVMGQRNTISLYDILNINIRYCPERAVRLVGGRGSFEGRVEMFWDGRWGHVDGRPSEFKITNGRVICKYLGFPDVSEIVQIPNQKHSVGPFFREPFVCNGDEDTPFSCQYWGEKIFLLPAVVDEAAVICEKNARLQGGRVTPLFAYGLLEVYVEGRWGAVCDDDFNIRAANVACRQMGYTRALEYKTTTEYGKNKRPILMDDVLCEGYEAQITHCPSTPIGEHDCRRSDAISLFCVI